MDFKNLVLRIKDKYLQTDKETKIKVGEILSGDYKQIKGEYKYEYRCGKSDRIIKR